MCRRKRKAKKNVPDWALKLDWELIRKLGHKLDPNVVAAVIHVESAGDTWATRCEVKRTMKEDGKYLYHSRWRYYTHTREYAELTNVSLETESIGQATSWGLMQVMGGTARELGYRGLFPMLCDPRIGMEYGCKLLRQKQEFYGSDPATLYAAYNGGSPRIVRKTGMFENQRNVDSFMQYYRQLTKLLPEST